MLGSAIDRFREGRLEIETVLGRTQRTSTKGGIFGKQVFHVVIPTVEAHIVMGRCRVFRGRREHDVLKRTSIPSYLAKHIHANLFPIHTIGMDQGYIM
jgi:hypothetical protein